MSDRRALVTGTTGQSGSYVADLPLEQGSEVAGMMRCASTESVEGIAHLAARITLVQAQLPAERSLVSAPADVERRHVYDLAARA